jgi:hypothetical protein
MTACIYCGSRKHAWADCPNGPARGGGKRKKRKKASSYEENIAKLAKRGARDDFASGTDALSRRSLVPTSPANGSKPDTGQATRAPSSASRTTRPRTHTSLLTTPTARLLGFRVTRRCPEGQTGLNPVHRSSCDPVTQPGGLPVEEFVRADHEVCGSAAAIRLTSIVNRDVRIPQCQHAVAGPVQAHEAYAWVSASRNARGVRIGSSRASASRCWSPETSTACSAWASARR